MRIPGNDLTAAKYVPIGQWFTITAHVPDHNNGFAVRLEQLENTEQAWANLPSPYVATVLSWLKRGERVLVRSPGAMNFYFSSGIVAATGKRKRKCVPFVELKRDLEE